MARGPHRIIRKGRDRISVWIGVTLRDVSVAADTAVLVGQLNAAALAFRPFTVIRTRLVVGWESDQVAATESPMGGFGIQVVTSAAITAGIGSVPTPISEIDADYFVYQSLISHIEFGSAVGFQKQAFRQYEIDSKAMRKVGPDQDMAITVEETNSFGAVIAVMGRMLIKLH